MKGGSRPGAGRPKGLPNKVTRQQQEAIAASGETPLEYMLRILRDPSIDNSRRDDMAKAAAPYVHPRLTAMDISGRLEIGIGSKLDAALKRVGQN